MGLLALAACAPSGFTRVATAPPGYTPPPHLAVGTCPWSAPFVPVATASADPVEITEALALPQDQFWELLVSVPDVAGDADFDALSSALAGCERSDLVAFEARLTLALYALDGQHNFDWIVEHDPTGLHFSSEDSFLYSRCATVMAGRETWQRAVDQGTLEWGGGTSESLLYVGLAAAEAKGIDIDDYYDEVYGAIPLSYETGSNTSLWGSP